MTRPHRASGVREHDLVARARALRDSVDPLLPRLSGDAPRDRFDRLRADLEEVRAEREDSDRLEKLSKRGDSLPRAYAGLLRVLPRPEHADGALIPPPGRRGFLRRTLAREPRGRGRDPAVGRPGPSDARLRRVGAQGPPFLRDAPHALVHRTVRRTPAGVRGGEDLGPAVPADPGSLWATARVRPPRGERAADVPRGRLARCPPVLPGLPPMREGGAPPPLPSVGGGGEPRPDRGVPHGRPVERPLRGRAGMRPRPGPAAPEGAPEELRIRQALRRGAAGRLPGRDPPGDRGDPPHDVRCGRGLLRQPVAGVPGRPPPDPGRAARPGGGPRPVLRLLRGRRTGGEPRPGTPLAPARRGDRGGDHGRPGGGPAGAAGGPGRPRTHRRDPEARPETRGGARGPRGTPPVPNVSPRKRRGSTGSPERTGSSGSRVRSGGSCRPSPGRAKSGASPTPS